MTLLETHIRAYDAATDLETLSGIWLVQARHIWPTGTPAQRVNQALYSLPVVQEQLI